MADLPHVEVPSLTSAERTRAATAIGADLIRQATVLADWKGDQHGPPVRTFQHGVVNDVRSLWIQQRVQPLHDAQLRLSRADFSKKQCVGRHLRKRVSTLLRLAAEVASLSHWLRQFDEDSLVPIYADWTEAMARSTGMLVVLLATDNTEVRLRLTREYGELWAEAAEDAAINQWLIGAGDEAGLRALLEVEDLDDPLCLPETLFGVRPGEEIRDEGSVRRAYPGGYRRLTNLAAPQLRLAWPARMFVPAYSAANHVGLALKLGGTYAPLLANRAATLTALLVMRAAGVDGPLTANLIGEFHTQQAPRIVQSGRRFEAATNRALDGAPDAGRVVEAYRILAEGILRPYGSLLVHLRRVADGTGSSAGYTVFTTLGALENSLGPTSDELVLLGRLGFVANARNFEAHENLGKSAAGEPVFVLADGSFERVDVPDLLWRTHLLRSFLDGVDVAIQMALNNVAGGVVPQLSKLAMTETFLELMITSSAGRLTDGSVTAVRVASGVVTIEFRGPESTSALRLLALSAKRFVGPEIREIRVESAADHRTFAPPSRSDERAP